MFYTIEDMEKDADIMENMFSKSKYKTLKITYANNKINFLWAPVYILLWILLYYFVVLYQFHNLPKPIEPSNDETISNSDDFIAEYAERNLKLLTGIGPRVVGSAANEQSAVKFLTDQIEYIQNYHTTDVNVVELDLQEATGGYVIDRMLNLYQGIQNVVVKLSPRYSNSNVSLLINSHFDTVPGSPGAGDDGTMVVVMLEVLRVLAKSQVPLKHSVIFLFNGAEENPLQASHAFITQHKWADSIRAFINLDSAGNGGKEILFQSGPKHPWLMNYYRQVTKHPFASTMAEELFQKGFIPSDTDFRIFRDYGKIPGMDFAHSYNGYVYHTQYDNMKNIARGTFQHTGDNILAITKALGNAPELENIEDHAEGHTVFFDFLGLFLITYTEVVGMIINLTVCVIALIAISVSIWLMKRNSGFFLKRIVSRFAIIFIIQLLAIIFAGLLAYLMATALDFFNSTMTWFSNTWIIIGLYFVTIMFGLGVIPVLYLSLTKENGLAINYRVQMFLHSQCLILIILTVVGTCFYVRSSFLFMMAILFYTGSLIINLATTLHNRPYAWIFSVILFQILPYLYYTYNCLTLITSFIPMSGRSGSHQNPEILISLNCYLFAILIGGFLVPLLCIFRRSKIIIGLFFLTTIIFIILIVTPIGFPFKEETAPQRFWIFHTKRTFHDFEGNVRKNDSGYYILPMDRRTPKYVEKHIPEANLVSDDCLTELKCGLPLYYYRMDSVKNYSYWMPAPPPNPFKLNLRLKKREPLYQNQTYSIIRYEMTLTGPDHMAIFIHPITDHGSDCALIDWSFLPKNSSLNKLAPPYFIYFSYALDAVPLNFSLDFATSATDSTLPCFDIAVVGHLTHHNVHRTEEYNRFISTFPPWSYVVTFISEYDSYQF